MKKNIFKGKLYWAIPLFCCPLSMGYANETDFSALETINVETTNISAKNTQIGADQIRRGLVWDERDLIRHQTGITVTEGGRREEMAIPYAE